MKKIHCFRLLFILFVFPAQMNVYGQSMVSHDKQNATIIIRDGKGNLALSLRYNNRCVINDVQVMGQKAISNENGICSAIKIKDKWFTTGPGIPAPGVTVSSNKVEIGNIVFGDDNNKVEVRFFFCPARKRIVNVSTISGS